MNLKTTLLKSIAVFLLITLASSCSNKMQLPLTYKITPSPPEVIGEKVKIEISTRFSPKTFDKKTKIVFTPIIEYENKKVPLKTMVIKGEKSIETISNLSDERGTTISYKEGGEFKYSDTFIFRSGMENAAITVTPVIYKGKTSYEAPTTVLSNRIITTFNSKNIIHDENIYFADRTTAKILNMDTTEYYETVSLIPQSLRIYFEKDSYTPNYDIPINRVNTVRLQLNEMSSFINKDTWTLEKVEIRAYSSPDGEEIRNPELCDKRAEVGKKIINDIFSDLYENLKAKVKIKNPEEVLKYHIEPMGTDWLAFNKAFQDVELDNKESIVKAINSQSSQELKEAKINEIATNNIDFQHKVLPATRRVEVDVFSYKPKLDKDTILQKALTIPETLFNRELLYAERITNNLSEKEQIMKSYTKLFPNDWKGWLNYGNIMLIKGDIPRAREFYLTASDYSSKDNPIILNNLGVCMLKSNNIEIAKTYFFRAFNCGADVRYNSGLISMIEGDYEEAAKLLQNKTCNLNTAIAFMANGRLDEAKQVALCCNDSYYKYYLLALIADQKAQKEEALNFINKAIKINPKSNIHSDGSLYKYFK